MATRFPSCGRHDVPSANVWRRPKLAVFRPARAVSLIELLVVLFIIGVLISLLLPALMAARSRGLSAQCQNNVRQIGIALQKHLHFSAREFPQPNRWTIDILKWMEEEPLAARLAHGIPTDGRYAPRPPLFRCPAQPDVESLVPNVGVCHYVLTVDRPIRRGRPDRVLWDLHDREELSETQHQPWFVAPEISFEEQRILFSQKRGPHLSGVFYTHTGQVRGAGSR